MAKFEACYDEENKPEDFLTSYYGRIFCGLSILAAVAVFLFWLGWYLVSGSVPKVDQVIFLDGLSFKLPFVLSRWFDALFVFPWMGLICFLVRKDEESDEFGYLNIFVVSTFTALLFIITGLIFFQLIYGLDYGVNLGFVFGLFFTIVLSAVFSSFCGWFVEEDEFREAWGFLFWVGAGVGLGLGIYIGLAFGLLLVALFGAFSYTIFGFNFFLRQFLAAALNRLKKVDVRKLDL